MADIDTVLFGDDWFRFFSEREFVFFRETACFTGLPELHEAKKIEMITSRFLFIEMAVNNFKYRRRHSLLVNAKFINVDIIGNNRKIQKLLLSRKKYYLNRKD